MSIVRNEVSIQGPALSPDQKVLLLVGPAGAGKTSMGERIAQESKWVHISEDHVWDELERPAHTARTPEEKAIVQPRTLEYIKAELKKGSSVVLDFIVYEDPPQPIMYYQEALAQLGVPFDTRVLRPSVDTLIARQAIRGGSHDTEVDESSRRKNAMWQIQCLTSDHIDPRWVVDSSDLALEQVYQRHFANLIEPSVEV